MDLKQLYLSIPHFQISSDRKVFSLLIFFNAWSILNVGSYTTSHQGLATPTATLPVIYYNKYLVGQIQKKHFSSDWLDCVAACSSDLQCVSYNFHRSFGTCELNVAGLQTGKCGEELTLVYSEGFIFHQIRDTSYWSQWGPWSECGGSCGSGVQERMRCIRSDNVGTVSCSGPEIETKSCILAACSALPAFCVEKADGNYQDVTNCSRFIRCVGGKTSYTDCQADLVYDSASDQCVYRDSDHDCPLK